MAGGEKTGRSADLWCYGVFPGPVCRHSRGAVGDCRRLCLWRGLGNPRLSGGGYAGKPLGLWMVRRFGTRLVEVFFPAEKLRAVRFLQSSPKRTILFLVIFMIPGTPKDLLCYFAGLTDIKFPVFLLVWPPGRLPFGGNLHGWRGCAGNPGLSICRRSFSGYLPDQRGRPVVLPSDL